MDTLYEVTLCAIYMFVTCTPSSQALETLDNIRLSISEMQMSLDSLRQELRKISSHSDHLLREATSKSCQVERTRAFLGQGGTVLSAMRMVAEQKQLLSENEEDDHELLAMFFDQMPRKGSHIDSLIQKAQERLDQAEREEQEALKAMAATKEQVIILFIYLFIIIF